MLTRIENECKYFHRDSLIFFLFFFCVGSWKISFSNFFSSFRISSRVDWKSSRKVETNTTETTRTTSNVSLIHFLGVWCWVFYISIVKKENCLFGTVNIKGKWKTNQKNNNDNIFFFFFLRPRNRLILNRWKLKNWRSTFVKKISKILAYDWNENLSRFREKGKRY